MKTRRTKISELLKSEQTNIDVHVKGWVRTKRGNKHVNFIALNDGSTINNIQIVADPNSISEDILKKVTTGASIAVNGKLVESQGSGQSVEVHAETIEILGVADPEKYPLQPKKHSFEFLREIAHLRPRTNTFSAVLRMRHAMSFAVHKFFNEKGFNYMHTPIITGSDAEGAGEMFRVTTLDAKNPPLKEDGSVDYSEDFFEKETNLTVSGQLEGELGALAVGEIYTFGPTFRAENSNTTRHLAEFWMIEPEMAFYNLEDNMDLSESFVKSILRFIIKNCQDDLKFLSERLLDEEKTKPQNERSELNLIEKIQFVIDNDFIRISYSDAFEILKNSNKNKKKKFKFLIDKWGVDFQSEHERYLVEKHFQSPVIIYDYPSKIKAFYMRLNDDKKTVRAMDVLFPGIGEIIGGSQREERLEVLKKRIKENGIDEDELWWYLELREYGSVPHSGFGLGFERFVQFCTGMSNIRDVIPYPRSSKNASF